MIRPEHLDPNEAVVSVTNSGERYDIALDRLVRKLRKQTATELDVTEQLAKLLIDIKQVDKSILGKLTAMSDAEFDKLPAPLIVWFRDQTWGFAAGMHVYIAAFLRGRKSIHAIAAQRNQWVPFIIRSKSRDNK